MKVILNGQASNQHLIYEKEREEQTLQAQNDIIHKAESSALWKDTFAIDQALAIRKMATDRLVLLDHLISLGPHAP